jgi:hypothetical protein
MQPTGSPPPCPSSDAARVEIKEPLGAFLQGQAGLPGIRQFAGVKLCPQEPGSQYQRVDLVEHFVANCGTARVGGRLRRWIRIGWSGHGHAPGFYPRVEWSG